MKLDSRNLYNFSHLLFDCQKDYTTVLNLEFGISALCIFLIQKDERAEPGRSLPRES